MLRRLNGVDFYFETQGDGPPLLLLHGFTGSVRAWDDVWSELAGSARAIALDLIGHGGSASPQDSGRYSLDWTVRDLSALLNALEVDTADVLGYSMGGRVALHFALAAPSRVSSLVLESASPGIEDGGERQRRIQADDELAERIIQRGVPAFVDEWERVPLLALASHVPDSVRERQRGLRLANDPLGLANSLLGMGSGRQAPLWSRLQELSMPVQLVVGANDARYRAIAERMQGLLPRGALSVVENAGHTVHLDRPDEFVRLVKGALDAPADCTMSTN